MTRTTVGDAGSGVRSVGLLHLLSVLRCAPRATRRGQRERRAEDRMETITSFGEWLRRARKACDLTQAELAQRVGCAGGNALRSYQYPHPGSTAGQARGA